jgi:hypothetical protein
MPIKTIKLLLIISFLLAGAFFTFLAPGQKAQQIVAKTDTLADWEPLREAGDIKYVGSQTCLQCHSKDAQLDTPMAHGTLRPADSEVLKKHPLLKFKNGAYTYEIVRKADAVTYTVSDGVNKITEPVVYCFGEGQKGQVFIFYHNGLLYESRVTFYQNLQALDFTIAHPHEIPESLEAAIGRQIPATEAQTCFS